MFLNSFGQLLIGVLLLSSFVNCQTALDITQASVHGTPMNQLVCNKDTVIDFRFSPYTKLKSCSSDASPADCATQSPQASQMSFLDMAGNEISYQLVSAVAQQGLVDQKLLRVEQQAYFRFTFQAGTPQKKVIVVIPVKKPATPANTANTWEIDLSKNTDNSLNTLQGLTDQANTGLSLSVFNFLNKIDYGHFYQFANSKTNPTQTYLVSHFTYVIERLDLTTFDTYSDLDILDFKEQSVGTGDKLCYGSFSQGIFQTHIRQSYPLWVAWVGILFYWLYNLITQVNQLNCYDKKFEDNKWTCWGFYSLNKLGNQQYFTKLSRSTMMLITFSWQGLCVAILYSYVGMQYDSAKIFWFGLVAVVTSMPFPFVLGYMFLRKIYKVTLHKFDVLKTMKGIFNKKNGLEGYQKQIDNAEQTLYGLYYWYYVFAAVCFTIFWTLAVHFMMQLQREYVYFHELFLASWAIAFFLEHLIFDPFFTLILGNTTFYRMRGFFYDFRLGERYKQVQE